MANAVKMLPFPVTSDSAKLNLLWGRGIHGRQFGYRISFMMGQKNPKIKLLKGNYCTLWIQFVKKSQNASFKDNYLCGEASETF